MEKSIEFVPTKNGFMLVDNGSTGNNNEKEIIFTGVGVVEPKTNHKYCNRISI